MNKILTLLICLLSLMSLGQEESKTMKEATTHFFNDEFDQALKKFQKEYKKILPFK